MPVTKMGRQWIRNMLYVVGGTLLLSFGTAVFIVPFDLVTGGVSGIAIVLEKLIPLDFLTVDRWVTVLTWVLFFLGLIFLGRDFALKTLVSTIVYPVGLSLFLRLASPDVLNGFFCLSASEYGQIAVLLAAVFGGTFVGAGCAITFLGGGSTGGTDILAFTVCRFFRRMKSSVVIFALDAAIVVLGMFVLRDLVVSLLGIVSAFVCALVVDKVFLGGTRAFVAQIITERSEAINRAVIERLERTTTILDATGGYTGSDKKMVVVSFTMDQYALLLRLIHDIDPYAFTTVHAAHEITGEGWTRE